MKTQRAWRFLKSQLFNLGYAVFAVWVYWAFGGLLAVPKVWLLIICLALIRLGSYFEGEGRIKAANE